MSDVEAKEYWEKRILPWERARYSQWVSLYPLSWTVRSRLNKAVKTIHERLPKGGSVFELACGSGLLAQQIASVCGPYSGIDIASSAIETAAKRLPDPRFRFHAGDVMEMDFEDADLTVFLGLTDWLEKDELRDLFGKLRSRHILFSYTHAASWNPYRLYRLMMDRPVSENSYRAREYTEQEIVSLLDDHGFHYEPVTRPAPLNPGALVWASAVTHD